MSYLPIVLNILAVKSSFIDLGTYITIVGYFLSFFGKYCIAITCQKSGKPENYVYEINLLVGLIFAIKFI